MLSKIFLFSPLIFFISLNYLYAQITPKSLDDFSEQDKLPQSDIQKKDWNKKGGWGPNAATYPEVKVPDGENPIQWKQQRVIATAKKYIGLPYKHHHIPDWNPQARANKSGKSKNYKNNKGLDCSNFASWVYNYGLGIKFDSSTKLQSDGRHAPGRRLKKDEELQPGDLLFINSPNEPDPQNPKKHSVTKHVAIWVDNIDGGHIIDSNRSSPNGKGGVYLVEFDGWRKKYFHHARRIIEEKIEDKNNASQ